MFRPWNSHHCSQPTFNFVWLPILLKLLLVITTFRTILRISYCLRVPRSRDVSVSRFTPRMSLSVHLQPVYALDSFQQNRHYNGLSCAHMYVLLTQDAPRDCLSLLCFLTDQCSKILILQQVDSLGKCENQTILSTSNTQRVAVKLWLTIVWTQLSLD